MINNVNKALFIHKLLITNQLQSNKQNKQKNITSFRIV